MCLVLAAAPASRAATLPQPLTLEACLDLADRNSPQLRAAQARVAAGEAERRIARSSFLPTLRAEGRLAYVQPEVPDASGQRDWTNDNYAALILRQHLWDFGRSGGRIDAARLRLAARGDELTDLRNQRRVEIMARYFDVLLADRRKEVTNEAMAVAFVRFRDGRDFKAQGQISELELARLENTFRAARSRYIEAENRQRDTRLRLATALGVDDQIPSTLAPPPKFHLPKSHPEFDDLYQQALAHNPLLRAARTALRAADADYQAARGAQWPSFDAEARANHFTRKFGIRDRYFVGVLMDWPIFQGGAQQGLQDKALARRTAAQARFDEDRLHLRELLMDTVTEISTLNERLHEAAVRLRYQNKNLDLRRSQYELELKSDLGNAMVEYTDADLFNAQVHYQLVLAWARLNALLGRPVTLANLGAPMPAKEPANAK